MEFIPLKTSYPQSQSQLSESHTTVDNLLRDFFRIHKNGTNLSISSLLEHDSTANLAIVEIFNDMQCYKRELDEIRKATESVAILKNSCSISITDESISKDKYFLIQTDNVIIEKPLSLIFHADEDFTEKKPINIQLGESNSSLSESNDSSHEVKIVVPAVKLKKSAIKLPTVKRILVAEPDVIEFHNCEANKTYQKKFILRNIDFQLTRFRLEPRPLRSPFTIFIETNDRLIAPGMHSKFTVQYQCDGLSEPEEKLVIIVPNGQMVVVTMRVIQDPPILQVLAQSCITLRLIDESTETVSSSSLTESSSNDSWSRHLESVGSTTYDSWGNGNGQQYSSFDGKKCFVGEFVMITTLMKNNGGKGRFFIMSETDWCLLKIQDVTMKNMLIVPPFAMWPAFFILGPDEHLILYTYFFPESCGLQVDELYVVSDNCSVRTIEVIGDAIMFDLQSLEFDNNVKYQWFQMKNKELCTMRYMDLGVGETDSFLGATFTITSKCDLDVHYRWEVSDIIQCPSIYKITIGLGKTNFPVKKMIIEPNNGVLHANSVITFQVTADLSSVKHDRYRTTLRLVIEDLPRAAIHERFNFTFQESRTKRRLCEHPVDVYFEDIDIRFKCDDIVPVISDIDTNETNSTTDGSKTEVTLQTESMADLTQVPDDTQFWESAFISTPYVLDELENSTSDHVCRFIKGYGTCDCCQTEMISTGVLRPGSPLFVGVVSKFSIIIYNQSSTRIKYWWSQPVGSDHSKMKITIDPPYDSIAPKSIQFIELKCLPLETGIISSIYIACQFNSRNPLTLSIECFVRSLCVVFYFPLTIQESDTDYACIQWDADEYISKYDKKSNEIQLLSMIARDEETLHVAKLNSESSETPKTDIDLSEYEYEGELSSIDNSNIVKDETNYEDNKIDPRDIFGESFEYEAESYFDENELLKIFPYHNWYSEFIKNHFRYQPIVYEIHVHSHEVKTKRIYIKNDSPIASTFRIYLKHFWALNGNEQDTLLDTNDEFQSGIELKIEPRRGEIGPNETIHFDVIVKSTTWGVYTDQINVEINYLPPFVFWIRIINDDSPIVLPVCRNSTVTIPKIRFTVFKAGYPSEQRKVVLENTSDVYLYVNWHCFLINDQQMEEIPFNIVLDMVSPFHDINELLLTDSDLMRAIERHFKCMYTRYKPQDDLDEINEKFGKDDSSSSGDEAHEEIESTIDGETDSSSDFVELASDMTPTKPKILPKDTEFQISLVPYYGKPLSDLFIITPSELFLPPKSKNFITIEVNTEKLRGHVGEIKCKACGFIRIPPVYKYKDNIYHRKDGCFMEPVEVDLSCDLRRPRFIIMSKEADCTFEFHTKHFIQHMTDKLKLSRNIMFRNRDIKTMNVMCKIIKPFSIKKILTTAEVVLGDSVTVPPNEYVQIRMKCVINKNWTEEVKNDYDQDFYENNSVTLNKRLKITYKEGFCQYHKMFIRLIFPSLAISTTHLNFGDVLVGERKCLQFEIRNLSKMPQTFELQRDEQVNYFLLFPTKSLLVDKNRLDGDRMQVTASFVPINPGIYKETVKVISDIDGLVFHCILEGSSSA